METTESWVHDNETETLNSYTLPPDGGISRVARPVITLTKCKIHSFYVLTVVSSVVVLLGLIGNALTISILWRNHIKSAIHFLLAVLAIADIAVLLSNWLLSAPISFARVYSKPRMYRNLASVCYVYIGCLANTFQMMAIWLTVLVTWQRYLSVCVPHKFKILGSIRIVKVLALALIMFSLLLNVPRYFERSLNYDQLRTGQISFADSRLSQSEAYQLWYSTILFYLFIYILPLIILIYMTAALIIGLRKALKRRQEMANTMTNLNKEVQKNNNEVTLSLIIVVITFMICQVMAPVTHILLALNPGADGRKCGSTFLFLQPYVVLSNEINSAVNFIIYMLCVKRFRQNLITMCRSGFRIEPHSS